MTGRAAAMPHPFPRLEVVMFKLICKSAYIVFQIVTSGTENQGIMVTEGTQTKTRHKPGKALYYWFEMQDKTGLIQCAARLMRAKLDKEYHRPEVQLGLFGEAETNQSLFDAPEEGESPLLSRAFDLACELPSTIKWKPVLLAAPMPCNLCHASLEARQIAYTATVKTPSGHVLHIQCQDCRAAEHLPSKAPALCVVTSQHGRTDQLESGAA